MRASDQPGSRRVSNDCGHSLEGLGHTLAIALWTDVRSRCPACWELKPPISGVISPDHRRSIAMKILLLSLLGVKAGANCRPVRAWRDARHRGASFGRTAAGKAQPELRH